MQDERQDLPEHWLSADARVGWQALDFSQLTAQAAHVRHSNFAQTIPIYKGSPIIEQYINPNAFIDARNINKAINQIKKLNSNE